MCCLLFVILSCVYRKLGWEPKKGESHLDAMLRGEVLTALALFGHDETLNEACKRFNAFLADRTTPLLPPDTRKVVECEFHLNTNVFQSKILIDFRPWFTGSICCSNAESQLIRQIRL